MVATLSGLGLQNINSTNVNNTVQNDLFLYDVNTAKSHPQPSVIRNQTQLNDDSYNDTVCAVAHNTYQGPGHAFVPPKDGNNDVICAVAHNTYQGPGHAYVPLDGGNNDAVPD